jgi:hypothetical protein
MGILTNRGDNRSPAPPGSAISPVCYKVHIRTRFLWFPSKSLLYQLDLRVIVGGIICHIISISSYLTFCRDYDIFMVRREDTRGFD